MDALFVVGVVVIIVVVGLASYVISRLVAKLIDYIVNR
jgi:hypothetical protein